MGYIEGTFIRGASGPLTTMSAIAHVHVRKMEIGDFEFVRELATQQSHFTVPPLYVLWLLLRIRGAISLVAESSTVGPVAYLLAVPVESPEDCCFVWQMATKSGQPDTATVALVHRFREIAASEGIQVIAFSAVDDSARYRAIRRYVKNVFSAEPSFVAKLPSPITQDDEQEYQFPMPPA